MDFQSCVPRKRLRRYLGEIHQATSIFLNQPTKELQQCVEAESYVTCEGSSNEVARITNQFSQQKAENEQLREELESFRKENLMLREMKFMVEEENETTKTAMNGILENCSDRVPELERKNNLLKEALKKKVEKFEVMYKSVGNQRKQDAECLQKSQVLLTNEQAANAELRCLCESYKQQLLAIENELKRIHSQKELDKQKTASLLKQTEMEHSACLSEFQTKIDDLQQTNSDLRRIQGSSPLERQQYDKMKLCCTHYKEKNGKLTAENEDLKTKQIKFEEYKRYEMEYQQKQKDLEKVMTTLKDEEISNSQLSRQLSEWKLCAQNYVKDVDISPLSLKQFLVKVSTDLQALQFERTTLKQENDELNEQKRQIILQVEEKEAMILTLNRILQSLKENKIVLEETNDSLLQQCELLEIKLRGQELDDSLSNSVKETILTQVKKTRECYEKEQKQGIRFVKMMEDKYLRLIASCKTNSELEYQNSCLMNENKMLEEQNAELRSKLLQIKDGHQEEAFPLNFSLPNFSASEAKAIETADNLSLQREFDSVVQKNKELTDRYFALKTYCISESKAFREAVLSILGWNFMCEKAEDGIRFRLSSLYSTHDGEFIFYPQYSEKTDDTQDYGGAHFELYFSGCYVTKWERDSQWKSKIMNQSYPLALASVTLDELESIRAKFPDQIPKNSSGMLLPKISFK